MIIDIYDLSLFISIKAFLPSLRVLKTSQDKEEMTRMVSIIKELRVKSILLINLLNYIKFGNLKFKKIQTLELEYAGISIPPS